jgi:endonuclease YncB( thermonuclease family)
MMSWDMEKQLYYYFAKILKVIDADTVELDVDCGFDIWLKKSARLARINAYEIKLGTNTTIEQKKAGLQGKEYVVKLLEGKKVIIKSVLDKEKYGRILVEIFYLEDNNWINLNDELVRLNFAIYQNY